MLRLILLFLSILLFAHSSAQKIKIKTTDSTSVSLDSANVLFAKHTLQHDTSTFPFQNNDFYQFETHKQSNKWNVNLGNESSPYYSLAFKPLVVSQPFYFSQAFNAYKLTFDSIPTLLTHQMFTEIKYVLGGKQEQALQTHLFKSLTKKLTIGMGFKRLTSNGNYVQFGSSFAEGNPHKATTTNAFISLDKTWKNPVHKSKLVLIYNAQSVREIGGISNDSLYNELTNQQKPNIPLLLEAKNYIQTRGVGFTHEIRNLIFNSTKINDTLTLKTFVPRNAWFVQAQYTQAFRTYSDINKDSLFFKYYYYNTETTYDSLNTYNYTLNIGKQWFSPNYMTKNKLLYRNFIGKIYVQKQFLKFYTYSFDSSFNLTSIHGEAFLKSNNAKLFFNTQNTYQIAGFNKNGYYLTNKFLYFLTKHWQFQGVFTAHKSKPFFDWMYVNSNHLQYNNFNLKQQYQSIQAGIAWKNLISLKAVKTNIIETIVLNSQNTFSQLKNFDVNQIQLELAPTLKKVAFSFDIIYQNHNADSLFSLPKFLCNGSITYMNQINLKSRYKLGLDFFYIQAFSIPNYQPELMLFNNSFQNTTTFLPQINVYASLTIKRMDIFLKCNNLSQNLLSKQTNQNVRGYPIVGRRIYLGLAWKFYD